MLLALRLTSIVSGVMTGLAAIFAIALYCTAWTIYLSLPRSLPRTLAELRSLLNQSGFRDIVISLGATYFLYVLSSVFFRSLSNSIH